MAFDTVLLAGRKQRMVEAGFWKNRTINDYLEECASACPEKIALTAKRVDEGTQVQFTYAQLLQLADRMAVGLYRLGVRKQDVVACQLPNWWQFSLLYLACSRIGAVINPLMPIFRERELSFMLGHSEAAVLVVPKEFRGFDYEKMAHQLQKQLPNLEHVLVIDGQSDKSFEALLVAPEWEKDTDAAQILKQSRPDADDVTQLLYTSGTTGEPKGVMHSANSLFANIHHYADRLHLGGEDVVLMASPMAHQTGFMYGLMMPILLKGHAVLQDIWDPAQAVSLIQQQVVSFTMASTPFLTDLANYVSDNKIKVPSLRVFLCAGAPIPGPLVESARQALGAKIVSAWGMTENGAVTLTRLEDADERSFNTDGCPLPGVEIKLLDEHDEPVATHQEGRVLLRACSNFLGYLKRPHLNSTCAQDWFDTGDLARLDEQGYIRITGRSRDVIIRGGENIPVVEIESLLYKHPAIAKVAIVAYPDMRLGERACAVIVTRPKLQVTLIDIIEYLKAQQVANQYIPEKVIVLDDLPATPSGKIQKFKLREMLLAQKKLEPVDV